MRRPRRFAHRFIPAGLRPSRALVLTLTLALSGLFAGRAEAHLFEFYIDGYGGGLYAPVALGGNLNAINAALGSNSADDFYHNQSGGLLGARVGMELLYTDLYVQFDQYFNGTGAAGSAVNLMLGWDGTFGPKPGWNGTFGGYGGVIFGFPYTPSLPISREQISALGVAAELQGGAEYHFRRFFVFQALGTIGYHYLFDRSTAVTVDSSGVTAPQAHGFHFLAKVGFRFHLTAL